MLPRMVLNSWPQAIFLPQSPKMLGYRRELPSLAYIMYFIKPKTLLILRCIQVLEMLKCTSAPNKKVCFLEMKITTTYSESSDKKCCQATSRGASSPLTFFTRGFVGVLVRPAYRTILLGGYPQPRFLVKGEPETIHLEAKLK